MENSKEEKLKKLMALKQDYARKKKKLEKCKQAAQIKAHVRQKIKEHEEIDVQANGPLQTCDNQATKYKHVKASISGSNLTSKEASAHEGSTHGCCTQTIEDKSISTPHKKNTETCKGFREKLLEPSWIHATVNTYKQNIHSTVANEPVIIKKLINDSSQHLNKLSSPSNILNEDNAKLITSTYQTENSTEQHSHQTPPVKKRKVIPSESDDEVILASQVSTGLAYPLVLSTCGKNAKHLSASDFLQTTPTFEKINFVSPKLKGETISNSSHSISDSEFLNILGVTPKYESKADSKENPSHADTNDRDSNLPSKRVEQLSLAKIYQAERNIIDPKHVSEKIFKQVHLENMSGSIKSESSEELCNIIPETERFDSQGSLLNYAELSPLPFSQSKLSEGLLADQYLSKVVKLGKRRSPRILYHNSESSTDLSSSSVHGSKSSQQEDRVLSARGVQMTKRSLAQQKKAAAILSVFQFLIEEARKPKWNSEFQLPVSFIELRKIKEKNLQLDFACECDSSELVMAQIKLGQPYDITNCKPDHDVFIQCYNVENKVKEKILSPGDVSENFSSEVKMLTSVQQNPLTSEQQSIKQGVNRTALPENKDCQSDTQKMSDKTSTTLTPSPIRSQKSQNSGCLKLFEQKLVAVTETKVTTNAIDVMNSHESESSSQKVLENKPNQICQNISQTNPGSITCNVPNPNVSLSCHEQRSKPDGLWRHTEEGIAKSPSSNNVVSSAMFSDCAHQSPSACQVNIPLSNSDLLCSPLLSDKSPQIDYALKNNQTTPSIGTPSPVVHSMIKKYSLTSTPKTTRPKTFASRLNMSSYMKNSKMLFECNKDLERSAYTLETCSPKPLSLKSIDDEKPNNLGLRLFSSLYDKNCSKSDSIKNDCSVMSPAVSANLSNILQFDDSYLSPGQIPVNTSIESFADHLGSSIDFSMLLVEPWKKLPRTPTTPLQVLEDKSAQNFNIPIVYTPSRRISRSQTTENPFKEEKTLKFSGCFQSCCQDAVVSVLCGQLKLESGESRQFIVSVQATSLTVWTEDDHFGWTTELDWRLAPEIHIMNAILLPVMDRIAVIASGLDKGQLFVSLFVYMCSSEDTKRFNIPLTEFQSEIGSFSKAVLCVASVTELLIGLSTDSSHFVAKVIFSDDLNTILSVSKFDRQPSQLMNVLMVKNMASAFIILSTDQNISIWNSKLGRCLKKISLPSSVPCLTAMIAAKAYQGFLILDTIWRVDSGDCGGIVILNPVTCKAYPVVAFPTPNSSWRRTENAKKEAGLITALNDRGSLCIWDRKTGKIVGHTKSNLTTCASLMTLNKTLLVGEIHGCLHLYRTS